MPTLMIQLPGLPPVLHVLKDETVTIGRMKGNTIMIEDSSISLMHAKITRKDGEFYLKDLNSTNGTVVNGQPVSEARLRDQDRVRFADITTQFVADAPASAVQPALAPGPSPLGSPPGPPAVTPQKAASPAPVPSRPKTKARRLAAAAAIAVVLLTGLGVGSWKISSMSHANAQNDSEAIQRSRKSPVSTVAASQVLPVRAAVEAKPALEEADTPTPQTIDLPELLKALKSDEVTERRRAASALHGAGAEAKAAIPALRNALKDADEEVQMWAALALVNTQTYEKAVIPILVRALKNDNSVLRQVASLSLGLISYEAGDKETVIPALTEAAAKDADEDVRKAAKSALGIVAPDVPESAAVK